MNHILSKITDQRGNQTPDISFIIDKTAPTIDIKDGMITNKPVTPTIKDANLTKVTLDGNAYKP